MVCGKTSLGSSKNIVWFSKEARLVFEKATFRSYEVGKTFSRER